MKFLLAVLLCCLGVDAAAAKTEIGTLQAAAYRIDVPDAWNRQLIVHFHGYTEEPVAFAEGDAVSPMFDPMLKQGYAVIQSGYSRGGWAIEDAVKDTEALRRYFVAHYGTPKRQFVMGMSMGGALTAYTIETAPQTYAGALALCGAIEPTDRLLQRDFALRAAFDYYFPDLLGPLVPVPADYRADAATVQTIARAFAQNPRAAEALFEFYGVGRKQDLPDVMAFVGITIGEMQRRVRGNPFENADLIYTGSGDDTALNAGVKRYRAEPGPRQALARWYTPSGKLTRPLLALHDVGDPLVPAAAAFEYALAAQRAGHGANFVQQYVPRDGHCVFTPAEIGTAFDELVKWVDGGARPASGILPVP